MSWVTVLFSKAPEVLAECKRLASIDESFKYTVKEGVEITSDSRNRAFKRGGWFYRRYNVFYQVLKAE